MKTEDLIKAMAADAKSAEPPITQTIAVAVGLGAVISAMLLFLTFGYRENFVGLLETSVRFVFKFILTLSIAIPAFILVRRLARPDFDPANHMKWLALAPAVLAVGVLTELYALPEDAWEPNMVGHNAVFCLVVIPLLSLAPLVSILYALRRGAPTRPVLTGAIGGLLAGGIAATIYAAHCPDDSPLFLAAWYSIGILLITGIGALLGSRLLRW